MDNNTLTLNSVEPGAPVDLYTFFLLRLCYEYYGSMGDPTNRKALDARTASLISFLPDRQAREMIWAQYILDKGPQEDQTLTASVHAVGNTMSYLAQVMDLTKSSWGGFL